MQSHENAHEVIERYFTTYRALPASRAKSLTPTKRARIEASKRCYHAMKWHLAGHFHHQRVSSVRYDRGTGGPT